MINKIALQLLTVAALGFMAGCARNTVEPAPAAAAPAVTATAPAPTSSTSAPVAAAKTKPTASSSKSAAAATSPAGKLTGAHYIVPSGTTLTVRLNDTLASNMSQAGQSFTATMV